MLIAVYAWTINRTKCPFALIVNLYIINHSRPATALITADWRLLSNYKAPGGIITLMRRRKRVEKPRKEPEDGTSEQVARYWPPHTYEECLSVSSCPRRGLRALSSPLCVIPRVVSRHFSLSLSLSLSLSSFFLLRYFHARIPVISKKIAVKIFKAVSSLEHWSRVLNFDPLFIWKLEN